MNKEIIKNRTSPGIIIFDLHRKPLYLNHEASKIVSSAQRFESRTGNTHQCIPSEVYECYDQLIERINPSNDISEKRTYVYSTMKCDMGYYALRAFFIKGRNAEVAQVLVTIDKTVDVHRPDFKQIQLEFELTTRELEVLELLCEGFSNKEIAKKLSISVYTVKDHIKHIMEKTTTSSRGEIVANMKYY
ncbi:MAG: uncharacterized protein HW406_125 [Candidatus Brocadiaceae bacterium]|nr:uncharacterized protein [Candidatus Brocadiaceae bacterium]